MVDKFIDSVAVLCNYNREQAMSIILTETVKHVIYCTVTDAPDFSIFDQATYCDDIIMTALSVDESHQDDGEYDDDGIEYNILHPELWVYNPIPKIRHTSPRHGAVRAKQYTLMVDGEYKIMDKQISVMDIIDELDVMPDMLTNYYITVIDTLIICERRS